MEGRESMDLPPSGPLMRPPGTSIGIGIGISSRTNEPSPNVTVIHGTNAGMMKRKRGRPRKYGPDGTMALALSPLSSLPGMFSPSNKRGRGRPPGSGRKQQLAALGEWLAGSAGVGFTPHVIAIAAGEDIATKIMSFSQQGPRAICILSAHGAISNVTLRQPTASGGTVTYEGRFDIVSLSGSFLLSENSGTRSRTGGLSVSLAGPDGCVIGGGVGGTLVAAGPVQVIVGSFVPNGKKVHGKPANPESVFGHSHSAASEHPGTKHGGVGSTLNPSTGPSAFNTVAQQSTQNTAMFQSMGRQYSHSMGEPWHTTNISISLPGG